MNSMFATVAPARNAIAMPSPDAMSGLLVYRYVLPQPPVASSTMRARQRSTRPRLLVHHVRAADARPAGQAELLRS